MSPSQPSHIGFSATDLKGAIAQHPRQPVRTLVRDPDKKIERSKEDVKADPVGLVNESLGTSPEDIRTADQKFISKIHFAALCWTLVLGGWNDGSTGALLPRIQAFYGVEYIILSLIFVFACFGFMAGSVIVMYATPKLGFGKTLVLGAALQTAAYCIQSSAPPFPVFVMAYSISGISLSLQDAQANGFVATLKYNAAFKMGLLHSSYGFGLFIAPFVSTQFAQLHRWSFHFLVSLCMSLSNLVSLALVFRFKSLSECLAQGGEPVQEESPGNKGSLFRQVMSNWGIHFAAFFIIVHLGVGVTISGWIVTYIMTVRGGNASAGYISAGVSGGTMFGRIGLLWVSKKLGERNALFLYSILCIALELIVWLVPSLIGNAVAICFVGFFLGPMFPITATQMTRVLPSHLLTGAIGWIAGFGQTGSALVPFMTGAIASSKHGLKSMPPLLVAMTGLMTILWAFVPYKPQKARAA